MQNSQDLTVREYSYLALDLATGTVTDVTGGDFTGGSAPSTGTYDKYSDYTPTCGAVDAEGNVYVGLSLFRANMDSPETGARAAIIKLTNISPSTSTTVLFHQPDGGGTYAGEVFLEFLHTIQGDNKRLYIATYRASDEGQGNNDRYALQWLTDTDALSPVSVILGKYLSDYPIQGLGSIDIGSLASPAPKIFFYEAIASQMKYISDNGGLLAEVPSTAHNAPWDGADTHILDSSITWIPEIKEGYWISSNIPVPVSRVDLTGRMYFSKWSFMFPVRIELARFEGMNVWDTIRYIAEIADAKFGFHPDGNFFFKETPRHYKSVYTFTNVSENRLNSIEKGRGQPEIINFSQITPNQVRIGDIDISVELTQDSKYSTGNDRHVITVSQRDIYPKSINLRCIKGGRIATSTSDTKGAEFEFRVYQSSINTTLLSDYDKDDSSGKFYIITDEAKGVRLGSAVEANGINSNGDDISASGFVGHQIKYSSAELRLSAVVDANTSQIPLQLSSGTLDLAQDMDDIGRPIQSGDLILAGKLDGSDPQWEYMQVIYKDSGNDALVVNRSSEVTNGAVAHDSGSKIWLIRNANTVYLKSALSYDFNLEDGPVNVYFSQPYADKSSIDYVIDPTDTTSQATSYRTWKPINNQYVSVGAENSPYDTQMSVQLSADSSANNDLKFTVGDTIRIRTDGLIIEEDSGSVQAAADSLSIKKWKKRESDRPHNPFIGILQARWLAIKEVNEEKNPKYTFNIETILVPWISQLEVVTIQDQDVFPMSSQFLQKAYISSITMSPQTRGAMSLTLRGVSPY